MILIAGVGYSDLTDLSFGPKLVERLRGLEWSEDVKIEDFSFGPIAILEWFEESPGKKFDRAIFAGAMERGRTPGTLVAYDWEHRPLDPEDVQARISEAVTGVISLENLLVVAQHFRLLPDRTSVIELEPVELEWGTEMSAVGEERLSQAADWVRGQVRSARGTANGRVKELTSK